MENTQINKTLNLMSKMFLLVLISILVGFLLMIIVYSIPVDKIFNHVKDSIDVYDDHFISQWAGWKRYTHLSNTTDTTIINQCICRPYDSVILNALLNPRFSFGSNSSSDLINAVNDISGYSIENFPRYWHGYMIFFIPILFVSDIGSIRIFIMIVQFFMTAALIYELGKINKLYIYIFSAVALFINPITAVLSFHNTTIYLLSLLFMIIITHYNEALSKNDLYVLLFTLNGVLVAYFDFFTYPLVAWGLPLTLYIMLNKKDFKNQLIDVVILSLSWIFGYAFMWVGKWILASLLTNINVIADGINQSLYRISGDSFGYLETLEKLFESVNDIPMVFLCIISFSTVFVFSIKSNSLRNIDLKNYLPYLLIGLGPFVWYFVIRNHSYIHPWFEYRELAVTMFALLVAVPNLKNN